MKDGTQGINVGNVEAIAMSLIKSKIVFFVHTCAQNIERNPARSTRVLTQTTWP